MDAGIKFDFWAKAENVSDKIWIEYQFDGSGFSPPHRGERDVTFPKPPVIVRVYVGSWVGSHKSMTTDSLQGKCIFDSFIPGPRNGSEPPNFRLRCPVLVKL